MAVSEHTTSGIARQPLRSISDTALWMAYYRAIENDRPDALLHDRYARSLAGDRGRQMVEELTQGRGMTWPVLRTVCFDELIVRLIAQGVNAVLNLAAGLDTRPYRLNLPTSLRWLEVDLPDVIAYKEEKLEGERPKCHLQRKAADLSKPAELSGLLAEVHAASSNVLVLTEGLLTYLQAEQVTSLARNLHAQSRFQYWITDLAAPFIVERMKKHLGKNLQAAGADMYFAPEEGGEFFLPCGWNMLEFRDFLNEGRRHHRELPMARLGRLIEPIFPWPIRSMRKRWRSGVLLMGR